MRNVSYEIEKIINVANELASNGSTAASTSEQIAAAFVLDRMGSSCPMVIRSSKRGNAWIIGKALVKKIKAEYQDLLVPW